MRNPQKLFGLVVVFVIIVVLPILQNRWSEILPISNNLLIALTIALAPFVAYFIYREIAVGKPTKRGIVDETGILTPDCGNEPLDLDRERLFVTEAVGSYFASLLESDNTYIPLEGQLEAYVPPTLHELTPLQRIVQGLAQRNGIYILVIAADGGMGKSTLAAKLVRCLYSKREYDRILGDSAKTEVVNLSTGSTRGIPAGFIDANSFLEKLAIQVGATRDTAAELKSSQFVRDRLAYGEKALVVVDNLESIRNVDELFGILLSLASPDIRVIVTTRTASLHASPHTLVVTLNPIKDVDTARRFIQWHIDTYANINSQLVMLNNTLSRPNVQLLLDKTGGVPLIMQLLISDVARSSTWEYLRQVPDLPLTKELLDYLYQQRWMLLQNNGDSERIAIDILKFIAKRQEAKKVTGTPELLELDIDGKMLFQGLQLLHEHFLLIMRDPNRGDYVVFPSLIEFLRRVDPQTFTPEVSSEG